jgi:hypothetical protein
MGLALGPEAIAKVREGAAAEAERLPHDQGKGEEQPGRLRSRQAGAAADGPDPGQKASLVSVDVAAPGDHCLIEQGGLDLPGGGAQAFGHSTLSESTSERLRTESRKRPEAAELGRRPQEYSPEPTRIPVAQLRSIVKVDDQVSVQRSGSAGRRHRQGPGHAQVDDQVIAFAQPQVDELAPPGDCSYLLSRKAEREAVGLAKAEY